MWLWPLRPSDWETIVITAAAADRLELSYAPTWARFKDKFSIVGATAPLVDSAEGANVSDVWWISGTEGYASALGLDDRVVSVLWRAESGRRTPKSTDSSQWYSVAHRNVGGVTNSRGIFRLSGLKPITIPRDLPRTLAHIVKYSVRPVPCNPRVSEPHYIISDILMVGRASLQVL